MSKEKESLLCEEQLHKINECVNERLADLPELPVRVDQMTPQEYKIYEGTAHAVGALKFIQELLKI